LVCIASRLREKLDLKHGLLPKTANLFVDKYLMKNSVLDNASVLTSKMLLVDSNTKNIILDSLTLPVVLKPRRETGSVGVSILKSISDLNILDDLAGKDYLVENYIDGETYRVDGVIYEGEIQELFIFRDTPSCFDYYQYRVPQVEFLISDSIISQQAHSVTNQILNHLNYNSGVFHLELIRDSHGQFHFLEVAARPGGGAARKALKKHFNIDLAIQMMRIDAGLPIRRKQNHEESAIAVLMIPTPSRTKKYRINSILSPKAPAGVNLTLEYPANGTQLGEYDSVNIYISAKNDDLVINTLSSIDPSEIAKFSEWTENEPYN
jgi:biotin carboxylase